MNVSVGELVVLGLVMVIVFSAARMGQLGNAVGKFVYSFRKASRGGDLIDVTPSRRPLGREPGQGGSAAPSDKR